MHPPGKPIAPDTFSLLKFLKPDDLTLQCLAANLTAASKYLIAFPVNCSTVIANSKFCIENSAHCDGFENVAEQIDLLFDPVYVEVQQNDVIMELNEVNKAVAKLKRSESMFSLFSNLWYFGLPCFDSVLIHINLHKIISKVSS